MNMAGEILRFAQDDSNGFSRFAVAAWGIAGEGALGRGGPFGSAPFDSAQGP